MTSERLDATIESLIRAAGCPRDRLAPKALARHLGITQKEARNGLRRAARKGLLQGGRVPDRDAEEGNLRVRKAEFIREEMRQTGCLAIEAAERWEAARARGQETPARLLCDCVTGRHGRSSLGIHDMGCATGLGPTPSF